MILRRARTAIAVVVAAGGLAALAPASGAARASHARHLRHSTRSCSTQWTNKHGYSYLYRLSVSRTSCSAGTKLAARHGHERGWRCHKTRLATSPVQYMDRETCTSGRRKVSWEFSHNR
ncbi:MAG: hypothetical protein ACRDNJ_03045 [Solirubrobacteraceae bacterium]